SQDSIPPKGLPKSDPREVNQFPGGSIKNKESLANNKMDGYQEKPKNKESPAHRKTLLERSKSIYQNRNHSPWSRHMSHLNSKPPLPPALRSGLYQPDRGFIPINLHMRCT
ncbi:unnamed protein product, partial [Sphenostylis stenocarpa]